MKKLFAILLILALMLCAVGCQTSGNAESCTNSNNELDENLAREIRKAYMGYITYTDSDAQYWSEDDVLIDYYGTYSGCTVGYIESPISLYLPVLSGEKVGPCTFQYPDSRKLLAYKDAQIKSMPEAYDLGWLDDDAVRQIHEIHKQEQALLYDLTPYTKSGAAHVYDTALSVVEENHENYPKTYDVPAEDGEFAEDRVIICVYPFANAYEFTPEDFSELQDAVKVQCIAVDTLSSTSTDTHAEEPTRLLALTLKDGSRSDVINVITHLQLRYDIYYAQADYTIGSN